MSRKTKKKDEPKPDLLANGKTARDAGFKREDNPHLPRVHRIGRSWDTVAADKWNKEFDDAAPVPQAE